MWLWSSLHLVGCILTAGPNGWGMAAELRHSQQMQQVQQLRMTRELRQAIQLLAMPNLEMTAYLQQQLQENPVLEVSTEEERSDLKAAEPESRDRAEDQVESWEKGLDFAYGLRGPSANAWDPDRPTALDFQSQAETLTSHLLAQLRERRLPDDLAELCEILIHSLDDDGYLRDQDLSTLQEQVGASDEMTSLALSVLHEFEPRGVGARHLAECLLLQLDALDPEHAVLAREVLTHHLSDLEKSNHDVIARALKVDVETVRDVHRAIRTLRPRPAIQFNGSITDYVVADVVVVREDDTWIPLLNDESLPAVRLNDHYLSLARQRRKDDSSAWLRKRVREAQELFKAISRRRATILEVTTAVLEEQSAFLDEGMKGLKPLVLRDIAEKVGMSESTVSRATARKYIQTPRGVFPMKIFFSASLRTQGGGEDVAAGSVKPLIRELIEGEPAGKPLSDQQLAELLQKNHKIDIARRTVAKYREQLGILSSSRRKRKL